MENLTFFGTFGQKHEHPIPGAAVGNVSKYYVIIKAPTKFHASELMNEKFGSKWADIHPDDNMTDEDLATFYPSGELCTLEYYAKSKEDEKKSRSFIHNDTDDGELTQENINTLVQAGIVPVGTPLAQIKVFAHICKEHGLSPFSKEIYLLKYAIRENKGGQWVTVGWNYTPIIGIDGLRKKAARSGDFAGVGVQQFNRKSDGTYMTAAEVIAESLERDPAKGAKEAQPISCYIPVYRMVNGKKEEFGKEVVFQEFFNSRNPKWSNMPFNQLSVVAEKHSLRQAFAQETKGLALEEELGAFENSQQLTQPAVLDAAKEDLLDDLKRHIGTLDTLEEIKEWYKSTSSVHGDKEVIALMADREEEIKRGE